MTVFYDVLHNVYILHFEKGNVIVSLDPGEVLEMSNNINQITYEILKDKKDVLNGVF